MATRPFLSWGGRRDLHPYLLNHSQVFWLAKLQPPSLSGWTRKSRTSTCCVSGSRADRYTTVHLVGAVGLEPTIPWSRTRCVRHYATLRQFGRPGVEPGRRAYKTHQCYRHVAPSSPFLTGPRGFEPQPSDPKSDVLPLDDGPLLVAGQGFEPHFPESESDVLPLDDPASGAPGRT